jgi:hypothetical protein
MLSTAVVIIILILGINPLVVQADGSTIVQISPANTTINAGQTFTINVICTPGQSIKLYELKLMFNSTVLQVNSVTEGTIFNGYTTFFNAGTINNTAGTIVDVYGLIQGAGVVSNSGSLVSISFTARSLSETSTIGLYNVGVTNETQYVPVIVMNGSVSIPPNWDINNDGKCNILDLVLISNHYDEIGEYGWIREDVNNDGKVQISDLVNVSNHFAKSWR